MKEKNSCLSYTRIAQLKATLSIFVMIIVLIGVSCRREKKSLEQSKNTSTISEQLSRDSLPTLGKESLPVALQGATDAERTDATGAHDRTVAVAKTRSSAGVRSSAQSTGEMSDKHSPVQVQSNLFSQSTIRLDQIVICDVENFGKVACVFNDELNSEVCGKCVTNIFRTDRTYFSDSTGEFLFEEPVFEESLMMAAMFVDDFPKRQGVSFPIIIDHIKNRMNILIDTVGCQMPIKIWRMRDRIPIKIKELAPHCNGFGHQIFTVDQNFQYGDTLIVEYTPTVVMNDKTPLASYIDNRSGDPTTMMGAKIEF